MKTFLKSKINLITEKSLYFIDDKRNKFLLDSTNLN